MFCLSHLVQIVGMQPSAVKLKENIRIDLFCDYIYRRIDTHRRYQFYKRLIWEICICGPTVKDHLSQLPLHIELLIPMVYLLDLGSAYITEARKKGKVSVI